MMNKQLAKQRRLASPQSKLAIHVNVTPANVTPVQKHAGYNGSDKKLTA